MFLVSMSAKQRIADKVDEDEKFFVLAQNEDIVMLLNFQIYRSLVQYTNIQSVDHRYSHLSVLTESLYVL